MLQSQIDTRDKELATLYNQVDRFFGLPGFALTKVCKNDVRGQEASIGKETEEKVRIEACPVTCDLIAHLCHHSLRTPCNCSCRN